MSADRERERDKRRLDKLLDAWDRELDNEPGLDVLTLASKALPALLERRAMLLGLDATTGSETKPAGQESAVVAAIRGEGLRAVPK